MSDVCLCNGQLANTGRSTNDAFFGVTVMNIAVPLIGSNGQPNTIDPTGDVEAQILAFLTAQNPADRGYPVTSLTNVEFPDEGTQFDAASNGQNYKSRESIKSMSYEVRDVSYTYMEQLRDRCVDYGIYRIDVCGKFLGSLRAENDLRPLEVNRHSLSVIPTDATDSTVQKAMVNFQFTNYESNNFGQWAVYEYGKALLKAAGMLDAVVTATINSATEATLDIKEIYGAAGSKNGIVGLALADVTITNYTADTSGVALTSLTPSPTVNGRYTAVFAAQTTADKISFVVYKNSGALDVISYVGESAQVDAD